ncbi:tRNA-binding protein [Dongia deserti]|uniref:tRNA-binding protein n=1 Tax=Dongia deserti TaxID=2268030 RepID=UPI0013C505D2|nr:tRNA-binding protein [Dongia deserti]
MSQLVKRNGEMRDCMIEGAGDRQDCPAYLRSQKPIAEFDSLGKLDLRIGRVIEAAAVMRRRGPSHVVKIDLGCLGVRQGWLKLRDGTDGPLGRNVICVVNLPARNRDGVISEVAILGVGDDRGSMRILSHDAQVATGSRVVW